jgi:hypothetical protein
LRTEAEVNEVKALAAKGLNHCEIARRTGIPPSTVRQWAIGKVPGRKQRATAAPWGTEQDRFSLPEFDYAYLLGMYLGDGCISAHLRGVYRLRIVLDMRYPNIIMECAAAMRRVLPMNTVHVQSFVSGNKAAEVHSYSKAWPRLFPQHGPGRKHKRQIALVDWQQEIVGRYPKPLLRGLIHSDGCRVMNKSMGHEYLRYFFSQVSDDIRTIFTDPATSSASPGGSQSGTRSRSRTATASRCSTSSSDRRPDLPLPGIIRR